MRLWSCHKFLICCLIWTHWARATQLERRLGRNWSSRHNRHGELVPSTQHSSSGEESPAPFAWGHGMPRFLSMDQSSAHDSPVPSSPNTIRTPASGWASTPRQSSPIGRTPSPTQPIPIGPPRKGLRKFVNILKGYVGFKKAKGKRMPGSGRLSSSLASCSSARTLSASTSTTCSPSPPRSPRAKPQSGITLYSPGRL